MTINKDQLIEILSTAKEQVSFLGVVAIDADWNFLAEQWSSKLRDNPNFRINVLCESDNMLFSKSFTYDTDLASKRRSFRELKFIRDMAFDLPELLLEAGAPSDVILDKKKSPVDVRIMHLQIPVSVVQVDGKVFTNLWLHELRSEFEEITEGHPLSDFLYSYINIYFNQDIGRKYSCEKNDEILELFDHDRIPRGIYPRGSFYDTDYSQLVVWAFIFDRKGRLLIHRRSDNASDNREMWDKSVGGHVDFEKDIDTSRAVLREVIEELFSDEMKKGKVDLNAWAVSDEEMIYLGEWRPDHRRKYPFREIKMFLREWAYFRLSDSQKVYSPRTLPDGAVYRLRAIADIFLFVTGPALDNYSLGELKNSKFKLIELSELKNVMDKAFRNEGVPGFDEKFVFIWEDVPGKDSRKLLSYLKDDHDISWAEHAEIQKSSDGKTISISKDESSIEIKIDESRQKATLKIRDNQTYNLNIKKENGKLNIHDEQNLVPKFTPDLTNIMTSTVRDTLEEFSQYIKRYLKSER